MSGFESGFGARRAHGYFGPYKYETEAQFGRVPSMAAVLEVDMPGRNCNSPDSPVLLSPLSCQQSRGTLNTAYTKDSTDRRAKVVLSVCFRPGGGLVSECD